MPSRDVNAATRLAEASWRRDNIVKCTVPRYVNRKLSAKDASDPLHFLSESRKQDAYN